jgi:bacterial/archaeal transporter family-2 protein
VPSTQALYVAIALAAGAAVPFLASINAAFGQAIGSVYGASLVLCVVAFGTILATALATGAGLPAREALAGAPWWHYAAGCFFTVYVVSITFVAPKIGLGNAIILVVVAQIFTAVVIDHFGLFGAGVQPLDWKRGIGIALLVAGVALAKSQPASAPAPG